MEAKNTKPSRKRLLVSLAINLTFAAIFSALLLYIAFIRETGAADSLQYVPPSIFLLNFSVRSVLNIISLKRQKKLSTREL
ncbi:hypothetical protein SAMN05421663_109156 [Terribacillus halophilus]|uniref:Uncharacterized protein n=1 Tax=Terribacillus halophilus TaxID=361279 RepID=A0A1G6U3L5_9BACI|nr:hypothetical protein [Terribacillus halophilus]SDD35928.1 hypothetical protein SAMN05421663_109156 [Terribacillus halophilus]